MSGTDKDIHAQTRPHRTTQQTPTAAHVDAINAMFTQFQLAYHNQFHKAFANDEQITMAKQLWLSSLCDLPVERIAAAIRRAIQESEYLPTLHTIRKFCDLRPETLGLPDAYQAYLQACRAPSPKAEQVWSHPAVYWAGNASDWFFLASNTEAKAFPVFKRNYEILCERVLHGEQLDVPVPKALPETINPPLSNEERKQRMKALRQALNI
jgi:hypothetical protein